MIRKAYQYKLLPNAEQKQLIDRWLDMLRHQYNYLLADRFAWWQENRNEVVLPQGEFCQIACSLPPTQLRENPNYHSQSAILPQLKEERPWYKQIYSQVLQDALKRVQLAFDRFLKGDCKGKRSGKPRFKNQNRYRTFTYPQAKDNWIQGNKIKFPKVGLIKFIQRRCFNDGCTVKTASITKKADGYYVTLIVEDKSIPEFEPEITPTEDNSIAIDCGLEKLYVDDEGNQVLPQKFLRKTSQVCYNCLNSVPKSLSDRWHDCPHCGVSLDRDECSAKLIKKVGLGIASLKNA